MKMSKTTIQLRSDATFTNDEISAAFPDVNPGFEPFGSRVIVQLRGVKDKTKSGIILTSESQEIEKWNTQIAKVVALGPLAFKNRDNQKLWPEGAWCKIGDYVRIPKYNQDKWEVSREEFGALFMLVNDIDLLAKKTGNPLEVKAYI